MGIPQCGSKVRVFSIIPGGWLRSRPQWREMGPAGRASMPGAGKAIGRALGHGVFSGYFAFPAASLSSPCTSYRAPAEDEADYTNHSSLAGFLILPS